jgi:hypothetical protein
VTIFRILTVVLGAVNNHDVGALETERIGEAVGGHRVFFDDHSILAHSVIRIMYDNIHIGRNNSGELFELI